MLKFRPHHFLCTLAYQGSGYSPEFVESYNQIAARLRESGEAGDLVQIEVVERTDSICEPCPSKRDHLCEMQEKIEKLDRAHAKVLSLRGGDVLTWGEAKDRIAENFTDEAFEASCAPCSWKPLGICKPKLQALRESKKR